MPNFKKSEYWLVGTTALICIVALFCVVRNLIGANIPNPYVGEYIVGSDSTVGAVDTERFTAISEDFAVGADKYGRAVFKDPHKAFATFEKLYADTIELIKSENDLKPFSHKNYGMYKVYGWQLTKGTETERERSKFVTDFLDIYENSFSKIIPNTIYIAPTLEAVELWDLRPMVMIDETLYLDTGKESPMGAVYEADGTIKTNVTQDKKPTEHEQSNFGFVGSEYVMGKDFIQVNIDGKWIVFEAEVSFTEDFANSVPAQRGGLTFFVKPDEPPQVIGEAAAVIWLESYMGKSTPPVERIEDYDINEVTVISGTPKMGKNREDMNYHYVVRMNYDMVTACDEYFAPGDGVSGKGIFKGLFRELCVKELGGGHFDIISAGTGGGESEFSLLP